MLPSIFGENLFDDMFDHTFEYGIDVRPPQSSVRQARQGNLMKTDVRETDHSL